MNPKHRFLRWGLIFASACALAAPGRGQTTITPTASFGTGGSITTTGMTGAQTFAIPANLGQQRGANLFHSFSQFDIGQGDTAKFTDMGLTTPMAINNIIARIYSASASQINGNILVDTTGHLASANLFLINPNGVMFGAHSSVNVPGDFVVSTANYITLSDGTGVFYSDPTNASSKADDLTSAPVSAFGFFKGTTPNGITVNAGASLNAGGSLQFATGAFTATGNANLSVSKSILGIFSGGQVSSGADATVPYLTGATTDYSSESNFSQHAAVTLGTMGGTGATLAATGNGGAVVIRGGRLVQQGTGGSISASSSVAIKGDSLDITNGTISTTTSAGTVAIDTSSPDTTGTDTTGTITLNTGTITAKGGSISLTTGSVGDVTLDNGSSITETGGSGGTLSITSTGTITNGGTISTAGSSDPLQISALSLALTGTISTDSGALSVDSTGTVKLTGGTITSTSGAITLGATSLGALDLDDMSSITETGGTSGTLSITSTGKVTNAGTISTVGGSQALAISAQNVALSGTLSTGSGALNVDTTTTTGTVSLTGGTIASQGGITLGDNKLGALSLDATSNIEATGSSVNITSSGNIAVTGGTIDATGGGTTTVSAGGNITLTGGAIEATTSGNATGGNVNVTDGAGSITLTAGGRIATIATGSGNAGNVTINGGVGVSHGSTTTLTITGTGVAAFSNSTQTGQTAFDSGSGTEAPNSGIFSMSSGSGATGNISITTTGSTSVTAGGQIATIQSNANGGNAGAITITSNPDFLFESTTVNTLTLGGVTSATGSSAVPVAPVLYASTANPLASTGAISINALSTSLVLKPGAAIQTSTQNGRAGDINVLIGALMLDPFSDIQSLMSQNSTTANNKLTSGRTGDILVEAINLNIFDFAFTGPVSLANNAFIQTVANPKASGFNPVGQVTVYAGSLTEGGTAVTDSDGIDYDYISPNNTGSTEIVMVNNATLGGANGSDLSNGNSPVVQNLIGFPDDDTGSGSVPQQPAGMGIILDGTLNGTRDGQQLAITPSYTAPTYTYMIVPSDGTTVSYNGSENLFLSFYEFNLGINHPDPSSPSTTGSVSEVAEFVAPGFSNIIARITDGEPSEINGKLEEPNGTNANIFLLNPEGVIFTGNSGLDLTGALTVSTANSINFTGGGTFDAETGLTDSTDSTITVHNTAFLGGVNLFDFNSMSTPGPVTINAGKLSDGSASSGDIEIIAGDITLENHAFLNANQTLLFSTQSNGQLSFVQGSATATFSGSFTSAAGNLIETGFGALGLIVLTNNSVITTPTPNEASTILIRGSTFMQTNSVIIDQTTAQAGSFSGQVLIDVTGAASILTSGASSSFISTSTLGSENGGSIQINAASLTITGGQSDISTTGIFSTAQPADYYSSDLGYTPFTYVDPATATGSAGSISLNIGGAINVTTFGQISTNTTGHGNGGTITITGPAGAAPQVTVSGGGSITSSAFVDLANFYVNGSLQDVLNFTSTGSAGTVSLTASALTVTGSQSLIATSAGTAADTTGTTGDGGDVTISVDGMNGTGAASTGDVLVTSSGQISGSSFTNGAAGTVTITQANSTDLVDPATNPTMNGGIYVSAGGTISTAANGSGTATPLNIDAGDITLNTQALTVTGTSSSIDSSTAGASKAGDITIEGVLANQQAQWVQVNGTGTIASNTSGSNNGGTITITSGSLAANNGTISTDSLAGSGNGGNISVTVAGNASALGSNGNVTLTNGGTISAQSDTTGFAGTVSIAQSGSLDVTDPALNLTTNGGLFLNDGTISTQANGTGQMTPANSTAGNIDLNTQALTMIGSSEIISDTFGQSKGGDITIGGSPGVVLAQWVSVTNGSLIASVTLDTGNGGTISIGAGALTLDGSSSTISAVTLFGSGSGGNIGVIVTGDSGAVGATGDVKITGAATISAFSNSSGDAGTVLITQSGSTDLVNPATNPTTNGGLYVNGGTISTAADGTGSTHALNAEAGNITLNTQALTLTGSGQITSSTNGESKAGDITVNSPSGTGQAQFVIVENGGTIDSTTGGSFGNGAGGAVMLNAGALTVTGANSAISTSSTGGSGSGGSIALNVQGAPGVVGSTGDVALTNGGTISASSDATGDAGTVTITQSGSLDVTNPALNPLMNGGLFVNDGLITTAANGTGTAMPVNANAGNIALNVQALTLTGGAQVLSSTSGRSKAGDVTVAGSVAGTNTEFVTMQDGAEIESETGGVHGSGAGGTITIGATSLLINDAGISTSTTAGVGRAGDITIQPVAGSPTNVNSVTLVNGGTIMSESADSGSAGMIGIQSDTVTVSDLGSSISTDAGMVGAINNSKGEIALTGVDLTITNYGLVSATTGGLSPGGTITVKASNAVKLSLGGKMDASSTSGTNGGNGGSILIGDDPLDLTPNFGVTSPLTVSLTGQSEISCDSQNTNGGNIGITTEQFTMDSSLVSTNEPNGAANTLGGDITIQAGHLFYINNYSFVDSNAGKGTGGNILIDPEFTVLNHSGISAAGGTANGNVTIDSTYVLAGTSFIIATGTVSIDSLPLDLTGSLIPLPANLTDEQKRLREKCARAVNHEFSSFIVVGRGGTENAPEELQPDFGLDDEPVGFGSAMRDAR